MCARAPARQRRKGYIRVHEWMKRVGVPPCDGRRELRILLYVFKIAHESRKSWTPQKKTKKKKNENGGGIRE